LRLLLATSLLLSLVLLLPGLAACTAPTSVTAGQAEEPASGRPSVIATIFAPYDFVRQVAGDSADVRMLVPPGSETHSFEPTPQDIMDIERCDLFIYVGGESDVWVDDLLGSLDTSRVKVLRLIDCVATVEEDDSVLANPAEAEEDEGESAPDEHVWTAPANALLITEAIARDLKALDPTNASAYQANATTYRAALEDLDARFANIVVQGSRHALVFGDRFPFRYFADAYGLTCYAAFPGCSTATEPNAQTIAALIDIVRTESIPVVFYRELSNHKLADTIARETGARALELHSCHNISKQDFEAGETYLSLMERNAANLKEALD
jgi:zinc transport system substrate-binding protein